MTIVDYFNPKNKEHIKAFQRLRKTGSLPHEFCNTVTEKGVAWPSFWIESVTEKFADAHCEFFLKCDLYQQTK